MKVHRLAWAKGVHPRMLELVRQWGQRGPFEIAVAMNGGLRADESVQATLGAVGMSGAANLRKTPHGRGAALDLVPLDFLKHTPTSYGGTASRWSSWEELPQSVKDKFLQLVLFSEQLGYKCGARWMGRAFPNGDWPHHELPNWGALPFPPPRYDFPADLEALVE